MNEIIHGDCLEVMRTMASGSIDLVVISPPYNLRNTAGGGGPDRKWSNSTLHEGYVGRQKKIEHLDNMPHKEYVAWQRDVLTECMRLLKPNGAIFFNHKERQQNKLLQERTDILQGFPLRQKIIWKRKGGLNFTHTHFLPTYEIVYMIAKPEFKLVPKANAMTDVWSITQETKNPHPAPFPVELPLRCISSCLEPGNAVVLDPFMGSGTTAVAAERHGVDWIGIEKSAAYCEMARERIRKETELKQENIPSEKSESLAFLLSDLESGSGLL